MCRPENHGARWKGDAAAAAFSPELQQLYVTRGRSLMIYNGDSLAPLTSIDLGSSVDHLEYVGQAHELYVGCMSAGSTGVAVVSAPAGKLTARIALAAPEGIATEERGKFVFANIRR
jgi:hypothetical protein